MHSSGNTERLLGPGLRCAKGTTAVGRASPRPPCQQRHSPGTQGSVPALSLRCALRHRGRACLSETAVVSSGIRHSPFVASFVVSFVVTGHHTFSLCKTHRDYGGFGETRPSAMSLLCTTPTAWRSSPSPKLGRCPRLVCIAPSVHLPPHSYLFMSICGLKHASMSSPSFLWLPLRLLRTFMPSCEPTIPIIQLRVRRLRQAFKSIKPLCYYHLSHAAALVIQSAVQPLGYSALPSALPAVSLPHKPTYAHG